MKNIFSIYVFMVFIFMSGLSMAQESTTLTTQMEKPSLFSIHGDLRYRVSRVDFFPLEEPSSSGAVKQSEIHDFGTQRIRIYPKLDLGNFKLSGELQLLSGQIYGDTTQIAKDELLNPKDKKQIEIAELRTLYLEWTTKAGRIMLGQMTSQWGLGLLANSGEGLSSDFSDYYNGDIVERFMFATRPLQIFSESDFAKNFYLALGFDMVFHDENADLVDGDKAYQGVGSIFYRTDSNFFGIYCAYRDQKDEDGDYLKALAVDLYAKYLFSLSMGNIGLEMEGLMISGKTNRARFERAKEKLDVLSWGLVTKATGDFPQIKLKPSLEIGFASGDGDRTDSTSRAITFDPDYKVGMILFEDVLGWMSANAVDRVSDPALSGQPVKGYELSATNGSVTNAFYLYPVLRFYPVKNLETKAGFLFAQALAPVADPYNSAMNGGYPVSYRGAKNSKSLGMEINGGISYSIPVKDLVSINFGIQGGMFKPGAAFNDYSGKAMPAIYKARAMMDVVW
jgi:hypothetical protein